jgi:hypothetical protein
MLYLILFALLLKFAFTYRITHNRNFHVYTDYETPKWVYKKVYKHNKLTKSSLKKLKEKNDDKNANNKHYISEYHDNYNAIIACNLPLGLLQTKSD